MPRNRVIQGRNMLGEMKTAVVGSCLAALGCCFTYGQSSGAKPEFEVATVKPAPPPEGGRIRVAANGGPGTPDPGRINYENVTLKTVITKAWNVKTYQIAGPAWLDSERFNIVAKVPPGATKEQFALMLQNLLEERFHIATHREKKELPAYALLVGKNGPKMKPSDPEPPKDGEPQASPPPLPLGRLPMGKDGFPQLPGFRGGLAMMMMPGRARMTGTNVPMSKLVETLEQQVDRAVLDTTGLTGTYDMTLTFEPDQSKMMAMPGMMGKPMGSGDGGQHSPDGSEPETLPTLFAALQEQLGLRLEPRRDAVDILVIDHLERTPVDN